MKTRSQDAIKARVMKIGQKQLECLMLTTTPYIAPPKTVKPF